MIKRFLRPLRGVPIVVQAQEVRPGSLVIPGVHGRFSPGVGAAGQGLRPSFQILRERG